MLIFNEDSGAAAYVKGYQDMPNSWITRVVHPINQCFVANSDRPYIETSCEMILIISSLHRTRTRFWPRISADENRLNTFQLVS